MADPKKVFGRIIDFDKVRAKAEEKLSDTTGKAPSKQTSKRRKLTTSSEPTPSIDTRTPFYNIMRHPTSDDLARVSVNHPGRRTSASVNALTKQYINVADLDDNIESNFRLIKKQMSLLATFAREVDSQFSTVQKSLSQTITGLEAHQKQHEAQLVKTFSARLETVGSLLDKIDHRLEAHDKQIDELYSTIKSDRAKTNVSDFLKHKAPDLKGPLEPKTTIEAPTASGGSSGILDKIKGVAETGVVGAVMARLLPMLTAAGVIGGVGYLAYKSGALNPLMNVTGDSSRANDKKRPYSWWEKLMGSQTRDQLAAMRDKRDGKETPTSTTSENDVNIVSKNDLILDAKNDLRLSAQKRIILKADSIIFDSKDVQFKGSKPDNKAGSSQEDAKSPPAGKSGASRGVVNTPLISQNPFDPKKGQFPTPNYGSGAPGAGASYGGGYGPGASAGDSNPSQPQQKAPEKHSALVAGQFPNTPAAAGNYNNLKKSRERYAEEFRNNPRLQRTVAALAYSEVGYKSDKSINQILETMVNRAESRGVSLEKIVNDHAYYAPYKDGNFNKNYGRLNDANLNRVTGLMDNVFNGSNLSNLATDNASGGLAQRDISTGRMNFRVKTESNEYLFTKDVDPNYNGVGRVKQDKQFLNAHEGAIHQEDQDRQNLAQPKAGGAVNGVQVLNALNPKILQRSLRNERLIKKSEEAKAKETVQKMLAGTNEKIAKRADELAAVAVRGGPDAIKAWMIQNHYPPHGGAWCGDLASALVKSVGLKPPPGSSVASNWRRWGVMTKDNKPVRGAFAVRKLGYHSSLGSGRTGESGSHVTFVEGFDPKHPETFMSFGGNQGRFKKPMPTNQYDFFALPDDGSEPQLVEREKVTPQVASDAADPLKSKSLNKPTAPKEDPKIVQASADAAAERQQRIHDALTPHGFAPRGNPVPKNMREVPTNVVVSPFAPRNGFAPRGGGVPTTSNVVSTGSGKGNAIGGLMKTSDGSFALPEVAVNQSRTELGQIKAVGPAPVLKPVAPKQVPVRESPKTHDPVKTSKQSSDPKGSKAPAKSSDPKAPAKKDQNGGKGEEPMYAKNPSNADSSSPAPGDDGSGSQCASICNL